MGAFARGHLHRHNRNQRRIGHGDDDVASLRSCKQCATGRSVKQQIIDGAARQCGTAKSGGGDAVDLDPAEELVCRQARLRLIVKLLAGDDMDLVTPRDQVGGEVAD